MAHFYGHMDNVWRKLKEDHEAIIHMEYELLNSTKREDLPLLINRMWFTFEAKEEFICRLKNGLKAV